MRQFIISPSPSPNSSRKQTTLEMGHVNSGQPLSRAVKNTLPNGHPLLLPERQRPARIAERRGQDVADARAELLQRIHGLPVAHGEPDPVCVDRDDPGVHLHISIYCRAAGVRRE
jgi:hypothetical protein